MPLREYGCLSCGLVQTKLIGGFNPPKTVQCESCQGEAELRISAPSIVSPKEATSAPNPKLDVVIGQHAERFWQTYHDLKTVRKPTAQEAKRRGTGVTVDISEGCTRPMTQVEVVARKRGYKMLGEAQRQQPLQKPGKK